MHSLETNPDVDQLLRAGNWAQERRWERRWERGREHPVPGDTSPNVPSEAPGRSETLSFPTSKTGNDGLSIINENDLEAGSLRARSLARSREGRSASQRTIRGVQDTDGLAVGDETEHHPSDTSSAISCDANSPKPDTPGTSLGELIEHENENLDLSDSDESASDITDYTDLSLLGAFDSSPTPFSPVLLLLLVKLKEDVETYIRQRLHTIARPSDGIQHSPNQSGSGSCTSGSNPKSTENGVPAQNGTNCRKRARNRDEEDDDGPSRRNDDDGDKRKKPNPSVSRTQLEKQLRRFACPFSKRYPKKELNPACHSHGWATVHRLK